MYSMHGEMIARQNGDGTVSYIPVDEANTDYQRYLAWLADGNEPELVEG